MPNGIASSQSIYAGTNRPVTRALCDEITMFLKKWALSKSLSLSTVIRPAGRGTFIDLKKSDDYTDAAQRIRVHRSVDLSLRALTKRRRRQYLPRSGAAAWQNARGAALGRRIQAASGSASHQIGP